MYAAAVAAVENTVAAAAVSVIPDAAFAAAVEKKTAAAGVAVDCCSVEEKLAVGLSFGFELLGAASVASLQLQGGKMSTFPIDADDNQGRTCTFSHWKYLVGAADADVDAVAVAVAVDY